jgi:hypothetical protein
VAGGWRAARGGRAGERGPKASNARLPTRAESPGDEMRGCAR